MAYKTLLIPASLYYKNSRPLIPAYLFITGKVILSWMLRHRDTQQCSAACAVNAPAAPLPDGATHSRAASLQSQWLTLDVGTTMRIGNARAASPALVPTSFIFLCAQAIPAGWVLWDPLCLVKSFLCPFWWGPFLSWGFHSLGYNLQSLQFLEALAEVQVCLTLNCLSTDCIPA